MSFELYLKPLDWTGRQIPSDTKKGRIPAELAPIMERIGLSGELWCDVAKRFGKIFKRVAGTPEQLLKTAGYSQMALTLSRNALACGQKG